MCVVELVITIPSLSQKAAILYGTTHFTFRREARQLARVSKIMQSMQLRMNINECLHRNDFVTL